MLVRTAKLQRMNAIIHNDADKLLLLVLALQLLDVQPRRKRDRPSCRVAVGLLCTFDRGVRK